MFDPDNIDSLLGEFMVFKKRIDDRISLLINLDERGKLLLQGGEEQDCVKLEEELNDFHEYCLQVFIRLDRYYRRLLRVSDDSEYKNSLYHDMEMQELSWWAGGSSEVLDLPGDSPSPELTSSRKSKKQNGRLTPGSMGSLEWDDYDMSRSEIETKIANGEMTDDDSIPELSPFETRDATIPVKQSPLSSADTSQQMDKTSKRSNAVDIRDLDTDTRHKKPRTSEKMSETQRQQLNNDLEDVLSWLINVKCDVTENGDYVTIRDLEQKLSDLKDLQKQIEVRKPIVLSINLVTSPYSTSEEDGDELKTKLRRMNKGWEDVEKSVLDWKRSLQRCFVRSKAFRSDVQKIQERVKDLSRRRDDLVAVVKTWESPLSAPFSTLRKTHRDLVQIRIEILEDRAQVASLQDVSNLLFVDARYRATSSPPVDGAAEACDKLNDLGASLRSLLDRVADDIQVAETALQRERHRARDEVSSTSDVDSIASETSLHSSTPIKLKMLRRKVETNEAESLEKENSKDNAAVTDQASDADVTMPLPLATKYRTVTDYTEPDIHVLCKHTSIKSSTENIFLTTTNETVDSDVESGYVEYDVECELQVVRNAVNTAFQTTTVDAAPVGIIPNKNGQSFKPHSGFVAKQDIKAKSDLFSRGIKASIPFFLFFLFLYFILWLISASCISDDRTICLQRNNLHYSLSPMLTWTDGPPPT